MESKNQQDSNQKPSQTPTSIPATTYERNSSNVKETNHREAPPPPKKEN